MQPGEGDCVFVRRFGTVRFVNLSIRRIGPSDTDLFDHIAPEVFDEPVRPDRLQAYLADPSTRLLLAVETQSDGTVLVVGQCAAVLHLHPDKVTELYVDELGTASTHRRRGIGRRLMEEMLAWGREEGIEEGWLGTELDNGPARALYADLFDEGEEIVMYEFDLDDEDQACGEPLRARTSALGSS